ncbi:MAG: ribose 5-phosphate isomerase A [Chitinophagaceae bacterium]|nr:MAG: ribose 5-phosphate isomerase A [Chitinophagaceae bacterium]
MPDYKEQAARFAATLIKPGMTVGLGHGRTMLHLAETLAGDGSLASTLRFVSSSAETEKILAGLGLHVGPLSAEARLDLYFDGCDQFDQDLNALKSGGGIHTMEKITAAMSDGFVLVGDEGKFSPALTGQYPVVLEVVPAAITFIMHNLSLQYPGATIQLRQTETGPALTLRGNPLLELKFEQLPAPGPLNTSLKMIAGVIEHSLFYRMATKAVIAGPSEQRSCTRPIPHNHPWCFTFPPARPSNTRCLVLSWPFIAHPRTINLRCCFNFETFCLKNIIPGLPDGATLQLSPQ